MPDGDTNEIALIEKMLADHEQHLQEANETVRRETPIVANLRQTLEALKVSAGLAPTPAPVLTRTTGQTGTVSQPLPAKKPEYAELTIVGAIQHAFQKWPDRVFVHVDELVREIYEPIVDNDQFYRVKRTIVSETIRGISKGLFERGQGKNTFGLARPKNDQAA